MLRTLGEPTLDGEGQRGNKVSPPCSTESCDNAAAILRRKPDGSAALRKLRSHRPSLRYGLGNKRIKLRSRTYLDRAKRLLRKDACEHCRRNEASGDLQCIVSGLPYTEESTITFFLTAIA